MRVVLLVVGDEDREALAVDEDSFFFEKLFRLLRVPLRPREAVRPVSVGVQRDLTWAAAAVGVVQLRALGAAE